MPKEDCKYWDKCYQRNETHRQKYNHPPPKEEDGETPAARGHEEKDAARNEDAVKKTPPKREHSADPERTMEKPTKAADEAASVSAAEYDVSELRSEALSNIAGKNYMEILQKRIRISVQNEYDDLLKSNEFLRHKFLVEMPLDFYAFWKFASSCKQGVEGPQILEYFAKQFQLQLVGPFEFLGGRFHKATIREPGDYLRHWRFFYDPPEFQTIFVKRDTGVHYGYWRDSPQDKEKLLIARNDSTKGCEFEFVAGNVFDALLHYLEKDFVGSPFTASAVAAVKKSLHKYVEDNQLELDKLEAVQKERIKRVVTKTFHRAGIVVPYEAKTQLGYRPLTVSDAELKKILKLFDGVETKEREASESIVSVVMEKLQPIATAASIALDECDFGTSLELGLDLFCSGRIELHMLIQSLLVPAYTLLSRPQFIAISKAHLEKRSRSLKLSIFDLDK